MSNVMHFQSACLELSASWWKCYLRVLMVFWSWHTAAGIRFSLWLFIFFSWKVFFTLAVSKETMLTVSIFLLCLDRQYWEENAVQPSIGRLSPHQFSISKVLGLIKSKLVWPIKIFFIMYKNSEMKHIPLSLLFFFFSQPQSSAPEIQVVSYVFSFGLWKWVIIWVDQ